MSASASAAGPGLPAADGVIHDIGYRSYAGTRLGRAAIVRALTWYSLRAAFGVGRGIKAKIIPILAFVLMCLPAVINAAIVALSSDHTRQFSYDTYVPGLRILVLLLFIAAQAPELVSRDLRSHILPLYFARPIRRIDYPVAKLAAFFLALPDHGRGPAAAALPRHRHPGARRQRRLGADPGADSRPAARGGLGRGAGRARTAAGLLQRPPRVRHRRGGGVLLPDLDAGQPADPHRAGRTSAAARPIPWPWPGWPA